MTSELDVERLAVKSEFLARCRQINPSMNPPDKIGSCKYLGVGGNGLSSNLCK